MTDPLPIQIRPERPADIDAIHSLVTAAFGRETEAILVDRLRAGDGYIPGLSLIAETTGEIAGHVMITRIGIAADSGETVASTILEPLAVAPLLQNRGIGAALTRRAIADARTAGLGSMMLVGHPTYYPRFGFRRASTWGIRYPDRLPDDVFMAIELEPGTLARAVGVVIMPAAFEGRRTGPIESMRYNFRRPGQCIRGGARVVEWGRLLSG